MHFQNTQVGFFYRQFFLRPPALPATLSLAGQTAIVTGSNTGLGYSASLQLLSAGLSRLILAVRSVSKGEAAKQTLLSAIAASNKRLEPTIEVWALDLGDYASVTAFTTRLEASPFRVDFAILNAGVAIFEYSLNPITKHETCYQTNWLSTALLTIQLRDVLQKQYISSGSSGKPPVISIVGSETAAYAKFVEGKVAQETQNSVIATLDDRSHYHGMDRYFVSKLLLQCFFAEYFARLPEENRVVLNMVNPGFCWGTEIHRSVDGPLAIIVGALKRVIGRSVDVGARTLAHGGAVADVESSGKYLSDCRVTVFADYIDTKEGLMMRKKLWVELTEELQGIVDLTKV